MTTNTPAPVKDITEMQTFRLPVSLISRLDRTKVESRRNKTTIVTEAIVEHLNKHYPEGPEAA